MATSLEAASSSGVVSPAVTHAASRDYEAVHASYEPAVYRRVETPALFDFGADGAAPRRLALEHWTTCG